MSKTLILVAVVLLGFSGLLVYVVVAQSGGSGGSRTPGSIKRKASGAIVALEERPSGGLAWSKANYRNQYAAANMKTTKLKGLALTYRENERYMDIAGRAYSRAALGDFSYTDPAGKMPEVVLEYLARAETFVGKIKATGLKPNFAYQIKLFGRYQDDPIAFERIGRVGRWRLPGRGTNYTDKAYEAYEDKENVEAYLLFDFLVTDPEGNAEKEFYADSTLHVLWNASTQRSPRRADGCQTRVIRGGSNRDIYANPHADLSTQRIYAETEEKSPSSDHARPPIGFAFLPPGAYKADVVLTEESFHGYGDAGFWATVMSGPVAFEVIDKPRPKPLQEPLNLVGTPLPLNGARLVNISAATSSDKIIEGIADTYDPQIIFQKPLAFDKSSRYVLAFELIAGGKHTAQIFVADEDGRFELRPTYAIPTEGRTGWQRFEIEITSMVRGRTARLRLDPATSEGMIGVRNVAINKIKK